MKILGVITARGGSKRLPSKNIKLLAGKPLIAWTIEQARQSKLINKVIVSTEDNQIASVSRQFGAEVPFKRPVRLASDTAKSIDVIIHAWEWFRNRGEIFDIVALLQPTSPLREPIDIDNAIKLLLSKKAQAVVSVCGCEHHPYWSNTLPKNGCMKDFLKPEVINKSRQQLPDFYRLNGAIYVAYSEYLLKQGSFYGSKTFAYVMPFERSIDIDNEMDFNFVEYLLMIHRKGSRYKKY